MDSLLASYASSDEEDEHHQSPPPKPQSNFPPPKPPSKFGGNFFSSLPPPKSDPPPSKSLFSKLPQPKSERSDPFSLNPKPKKIVQFRPPVPSKVIDDDSDEDDGGKKITKKDDSLPQAPSAKSFLSSIPAPRNSGSLGALPSNAGGGRRSILEAEVPGLSNSNGLDKDKDKDKSSGNQKNYDNDNGFDASLSGEGYMNYDNSYDNSYGDYANVAASSADYGSYGEYQNVGPVGPAAPASGDHGSYGSYEGYSDYGNYGQYESKWIDRSSGDLGPEVPVEVAVQSVARVPGKRGRNEIPQEVIEVSQDELMKNRPREDQAKLTGIAFGPSYQPTSSTKGKPTKLHKRKHQIGSLYFDMRSKEMELAERRSKGFLTKAETQAKYGW
ncbi:hypothetical protein SSX86_015425 [Deinandra increscens subsp. villosa]|uniref:Proline-rich protein PRCC n=1 Tax=Deinandra increscens subsp. villosa TaxID=3103831 RepID=A0AAP0D7C8_9ASTR